MSAIPSTTHGFGKNYRALTALLTLAMLFVSGTFFADALRAQESPINPTSGPPGTVVTITDVPTFWTCTVDGAGLSPQMVETRVVGSGRIEFTVPVTAVPGLLNVDCRDPIEPSGLDFVFQVTRPRPVLEGPTNFGFANAGGFIPLNGGDVFSATALQNLGNRVRIAVDNNLGQTLQLTVSGQNSLRLANYLNSARILFEAIPFNPTTTQGFPNSSAAIRSQPVSPASVDVVVDLALITAGLTVPTSNQYAIYFRVDPPIAQDELHLYRAASSQTISTAARALDGEVELVLSRLLGSDYLEASTLHRPGLALSELAYDVAPDRASFDATIGGRQDSIYEIIGAFADAPLCQPDDDACIRNERPVPIEAPCTQLVVEDFAGDRTERDWFFGTGPDFNITVADDAYKLEIDAPSGVQEFPAVWGSLRGHRFADASIEAVVRTPMVGQAGGVASTGILLRFQSSNDFLGFLISNQGAFRIARFRNGYTELDEGEPWNPHAAIETRAGSSNTLRVESLGNRFQFYINNRLVREITTTIVAPDGRVAFFGSVERSASRAEFFLDSIEICER